MKNFNRCSSHGHHGSQSQRHKMVQHAHSHGSHAFTHTLYTNTVTTTWCKAPTQLLFFSACWVFLSFHHPPNSDIDYRIFNMHTWSFLCVRIHTGVGHTNSKSTQHFWLGKTHNFFYCAPDGIHTSVTPIICDRQTDCKRFKIPQQDLCFGQRDVSTQHLFSKHYIGYPSMLEFITSYVHCATTSLLVPHPLTSRDF